MLRPGVSHLEVPTLVGAVALVRAAAAVRRGFREGGVGARPARELGSRRELRGEAAGGRQGQAEELLDGGHARDCEGDVDLDDTESGGD